MYPGKTPNPQIGPLCPGNRQPNLLSERVTDRSASTSEQHAGRSPTLDTSGVKGQGKCRHRPIAHDQNGTRCSCHRYVWLEDDGAPVTPGRGNRTQRNQPPEAHRPTNDRRVSEAIRTLDDGREFKDLPLLTEKGGDRSDDESEDDVTEFRGRPTKSRTEKASDTRNRRRTVEKDTTDEKNTK
jgi:hypothetical protein